MIFRNYRLELPVRFTTFACVLQLLLKTRSDVKNAYRQSSKCSVKSEKVELVLNIRHLQNR